MKKITGLSILVLLFVLSATSAYGESVKMQGNSFPSGTIATASSVYSSYIPENVIDKDLNTRWNASTYQATLQLDFPRELNISALQLAAVATPTTDEKYTVFGFKNGLWTQISEPTVRNVLAQNTPVVLEPIPVKPGNYDAIKINIDGRNSWVAINEITYINQSLNAPYIDKIVDGPIALYWKPVPGATHYEVKRSETSGGPYTTIATVKEGPWPGYVDEETYSEENHYKDYYYVVTALNESETSPNSNEVSLIRPKTPLNVKAVPGNKEAMVTWDKVESATHYEVHVATSEDGPYQYDGYTIDNNKTVTKLVDGTKYYIRVVARNEDGYSRSSSPVSVIPGINQSLNAPYLGKIVDGPISLHWKPVPGATHYEVKRSETSGGPYTTIATVQERPWPGYLDTETNSDENKYKDYYYVVTALNGSAMSPNSNEVSLIRSKAPLNVQAVAGDKEANVTWDKVDNATMYEVYVATSEGGPYNKFGYVEDNKVTVTQLVNGTKYYIQINGYSDDHGYSRPSSPVSVIPGINQSLNAPYIDKIVDGPIALYWKPVPGATHYEVKRSETSGGPYTTIATVKEGPWPGYVDEETYSEENHYKDYYYVVTALNESETSPNSNEVSLIRPKTPLNVKAVPGNKEAMVTWDKVESATHYEVHVATSEDGPYQYDGYTIDNNKTVTKLVDGTKYYIRVVARNEDGYSRSSSPVSVIPGINQSLNAPYLGKIVDGPISLHWKPVPGATHYEVKRSETSGGPYTTIATVQERPWPGYLDTETNSDENKYKDYYYVVTALNGSAMSPNSNEVSLIRSKAPLNVQAVAGDKEANVTWDKVDNATMYEVYVATSEGGPYNKFGYVEDNKVTVTQLVNGTKYYIQINGYSDDHGYSRPSSPVSVIPGIQETETPTIN